jgi:hypothetical protein
MSATPPQVGRRVTQPGDVYVSIVPFVKDVNLGASNWNANWIYWGSATQDPGETDNTSWEALHGTCDSNSTYNNDRNRCRTRRGVCSNTTFTRQSTCTTNGTCSVGSPTSQSTCESRGTCSVGGSIKPHATRQGLAVSQATRPRPAARTPGYATYLASRLKAPAKTPDIARSAAGAPELSARTTAAPGCPVSGPRPPDRGPPRPGPLRPLPRTSGRRAPGRLRTTIRGTAA